MSNQPASDRALRDALSLPAVNGGASRARKVNPNDRQVGGDHYTKLSIQPWEAMESWMTPEEFQGFLKGNVIKYLARKKQGADLEKAQHYLEKLLTAMSQPKEEPPHSHSTETLSHFRCSACQQWWSIGDYPFGRQWNAMHCPRCGVQRAVESDRPAKTTKTTNVEMDREFINDMLNRLAHIEFRLSLSEDDGK